MANRDTITLPKPGAEPARAQVIVGNVQPTDIFGKYVNQTREGDFTTDYRIRGHYHDDRKVYMMGVTSPNGFQGKSSAFVQLANPTLIWISDWTCASYDGPPFVPDPVPRSPGWVLLDKVFEPASLMTGPDGDSPIYRLTGTYYYGCENPEEDTIRNIAFGRPPWLQDQFVRAITEANYTNGLLDKSVHSVNIIRAQ